MKKVDGQLTFSSIYPMLQAVKDGYGLAYLPESSALAGIGAGHYCRVLEDWSPTFTGYHLYYPDRRQLSPALEILISLLRYP